jgi:hypothetical protein
MAFSADELRVVRRALAEALHPTTTLVATAPAGALREGGPPPGPHPGWAEDVQEYVRLAESVDEAVREGGRLRAFLLADLRRYREALPGAASGYLERLADAVDTGYLPTPEDLSALRSLRALPCAPQEYERRSELLRRCRDLAEREVRARLGGARRPVPVPATPLLRGALSRSRVLDVLIPAASGPERPGKPGPKPTPPRPPKPGERKPGERRDDEEKPAEERPAERKPAEERPAEKSPAEEKPAEEKPAEEKPAQRKPGEPKPGETGEPAPEKPRPGPAQPEEPRRERRTPTPAEIWPPRRRTRPTQPGQPGQPRQPPRPGRPEHPDSHLGMEQLELATG